MGVRLYPNTTDPVKLERLAQVPPGTKAELEKMESRARELSDGQGFFHSLHDGEHEAELELHAFLLFGWGKFNNVLVPTLVPRHAWATALELEPMDSDVGRIDGSVLSLAAAGELLQANNIFGPHPDDDIESLSWIDPLTGKALAEYCEGVHWN